MLVTMVFAVLQSVQNGMEAPRQVVPLNLGWEYARVPDVRLAVDADDSLPRAAWKIVSADSEETARENGRAQNLLDGDPRTHWHTEWSRAQPGYPHEVVVDLGARVDAAGLRVLPRQRGPRNGLPASVECWLSKSATEWGEPILRSDLSSDWNLQEWPFGRTCSGRYLRLRFATGHNSEAFLALSEIGLVKATAAARRTDWASQYNIAKVDLGDKRFDLQGSELEIQLSKEEAALSAESWAPAILPHTAHLEKLGVSSPWQGVCLYRRTLHPPQSWEGRRVVLTLEGAMQVSDVWLNGKRMGGRRGGYLPVVVDLTKGLRIGQDNALLVRLDNRDNPLVPPGKPTPDLDFLYWSGLYREASLAVTSPLHISDPILVDKPASGGVYAFCRSVAHDRAIVEVRTHVANDGSRERRLAVVQQVAWGGRTVAEAASAETTLKPGEAREFVQVLTVAKPRLWSPEEPHLYRLRSLVSEGGSAVDEVGTRIGLRKLGFSRADGFTINGRPLRLIGTNRHQEYPWIGNALSKDASYRDMAQIKASGFNCVRLSHYPQDPAVMDDCDELGILAIPCIAGWQFLNADPRFAAQVERDIRDLIRRDRNHPCVLAWETSLNETYPAEPLARRWRDVAYEEFLAPDQTAVGDGAHGAPWDWPYNGWDEGCKTRPQNEMPGKPGYIREYGDYEFGGAESTTRQPRSAGEAGELQQAWNFVWSHNRNRSQWPWTMGDGTWVMYDYHRGYDSRVEQSGMADVFRIPRFITRFFQSQYRPEPMVFLATDWTARTSPCKVVVFSNGDEVELWLNGRRIAKRSPDGGPDSSYGDYLAGGRPWDGGNCRHLAHPPFTFFDVPYERGELKAVAKRNGVVIARHIVRTPGPAVALRLRARLCGRPARADGADVVFVYAEAVDQAGTPVPDFNGKVSWTASGPGSIVGPTVAPAEEGIATTLLRTGLKSGTIRVRASAPGIARADLDLRTSPRRDRD